MFQISHYLVCIKSYLKKTIAQTLPNFTPNQDELTVVGHFLFLDLFTLTSATTFRHCITSHKRMALKRNLFPVQLRTEWIIAINTVGQACHPPFKNICWGLYLFILLDKRWVITFVLFDFLNVLHFFQEQAFHRDGWKSNQFINYLSFA